MKGFSRMGNSHKMKGFTLIEILIAITVASIALAVLVQGLGHFVNQFIYLKERVAAQSMATSELSRKSMDYNYVMRESIQQGGTEWELRYEEGDYFFHDLEGLKEISVSVYNAAGKSIFSTSSIIYDPEL